MKKFIMTIAAIWLFMVFGLLQTWFWSGVAEGHANLGRVFVGVVAFVLVGLVPVKLIKTVVNLFK